MSSLSIYKENFFNDTKKNHLNNAGLAPISKPAKDKVEYWAKRFFEDGFYSDADYMQDVFESRVALSKLIGCESNEIAFFQNTGSALSQIAFGFDLKPNDQVLLLDQEYSSNLYPWVEACKRSGANLKMLNAEKDLSVDPNKIIEAISDKTKIISISWVQFQTGANLDIKKFVNEIRSKKNGHEIFIVVDVMQGLGIHPMNFKEWGVDAVAGGSHKWLTSPVGVGFLALKKDRLNQIRPLAIGSSTYGTCDDPSDLECIPKNDVTRFESGSKQVLEITALGASCKMILETGVSNIEAEALRLANKLRSGLSNRGFKINDPSNTFFQSPIVNFSIADSSVMVSAKQKLIQNQINFAMRGPGIRLSPHAFNSEFQIDSVLKTLS